MSGYSAQGQISIKRARKGESGLDGVSYQIRTSVESVRCAPDGTPQIASFTASLWRSQGDSNAVNVSATIKCNGTTIGTGTSVTINTASGTTLYTLVAFVDNEIKATKAIGIIKDGSNGVTPTRYFLLGSVSQLNTNAGRTLNPSCTVTAYKQTGNEAPVALTNATTNSIAVRGYNASGQNVYSADSANSATFNANSRTTTSYGYAIRFEITLTVGSNIDKLTIPVTADGVDGKSANYIYLRGTGLNHSANRICNINNTTNRCQNPTSRGIEIVTINRSTLAVVETKLYDIYGGDTARTNATNYLNSLGTDVFVAITSFDAIGWSDALVTALRKFGLGALSYFAVTGENGLRTPFAFLGYKGLQEGYALYQLQGTDANDPYAEVSAYISNGLFGSSRDGSNGADAVIYDIVLTEGWAKADPSTNEISARLKGYAYRITGSTRVALNGATIRHGYILNDSDTYATVQTNSSGYFDAETWFDGDYTYDYAKNSATIFAAIIINNTVVCVRYVQIMKDGRSITGAQGYNGCVPRLFDVGLVAGQTYYCNDTAINTVDPNVLDNSDGIRHLDAVAVLDATMESGYAVYQCKRNYTASQYAQTKAEFESISNWSTYFVKVSENAASAYFTYLMAQNAFIKMLAGAMMVVQDENANVIGGMQGNSALPIFWAGAQLPANGLWQQMANGFASYGTPNGERIELDPVNKTISFFNSSGQLVTEHNAKTFSSLSSLLPSTGSFTVETDTQTFVPTQNIWYNVEDVVTKNLSSIQQINANGVLKINYTQFYCTINTPQGSLSPSGIIREPTVSFQLILCKYSNSTGTTLVSKATLVNLTAYGMYDGQTYETGYHQATTSTSVTASVQSGFYYRLIAKMTCVGGNNSVQSTCRAYAKMTSASIVADYYSSKFFGNGIVLSKTSANFFAALLEGSQFRFAVSNTNYGLDISNTEGMKAKRGDYWHKQPITLIALRIAQSSDSSMTILSYNGVNFINGSSTPTTTSGAVYLVATGKFRIYFPTTWANYSLSTYGIPQCSTVRYYDNEDGYLCYVKTLNNSYLEVWAADDWSANRGSLYVELKMF